MTVTMYPDMTVNMYPDMTVNMYTDITVNIYPDMTVTMYCALWSICLLQTLNSAYEHISKHCFCLLHAHALVERNYIFL